jgi:hypothetical protein
MRRIGLLPAAEASFIFFGAIMTAERKSDGTAINREKINEEVILKVSKEVAIKFIEMGRITPSTFDETFRNIHATVKETVEKG